MNRFTFLLLAALFSCNQSPKKELKNHVFNEACWNKKDVVLFEIPINKTEITYYYSLSIIHSNKYSFSNLQISTQLKYPNGSERRTDYELQIKDENGKFIGEKHEDNKYKISIENNKEISFLNTGIINYEIKHHMPFEELFEISEIIFSLSNKKLN